MKKILIFGSSGAGKSTLAQKLGQELNIPYLHIDTIFWEPNWEVRDKELYLNDLQKFLNQDTFIIDGNHNYGDSIQLRIEQADTILYLNFNRFKCLYGAVKRYLTYRNKTRSSMTQGCIEKIDFEFIKYILWDYPTKKKKFIFNTINKKFTGKYYQFNNRSAVKKFLKNIRSCTLND